MAVTRMFVAGREQCFQQVERLTNSHSLRGSESLCKLLRFLAEHSLASPPTQVKEYQIATEVFGRSAHFDPQTDSTVRVQAGRLRAKLAEYYASEGVADSLVVKLPKGSYHLSFEGRSPEGSSSELGVHPGRTEDKILVPPVPAYWRLATAILSLALVLCLISLAYLRPRKTMDVAAVTPLSSSAATGALREFWQPFISGPEEPWVIFSNAAFVGRPESGMRYFNTKRDSNVPVWDHYTGVGEVLAVHALDQVFSELGRKTRVKRGSLFSLDDAKNTDLIFVGSPSENLSLLDIPGMQEFVFQRMTSGARRGDLAIVSRHPQAGEASAFLASPSNSQLTEDYAVVGLVPGMDPARFVMILAGTTTFGTQGAVEFVTREDSAQKLLKKLPRSKSGELRPFEALLRVNVARGVPLETDLVAVRER